MNQPDRSAAACSLRFIALRGPLRPLVAALLLASLATGCASVPAMSSTDSPAPPLAADRGQLFAAASASLRNGDLPQAQSSAERLLAQDMRSGQAHLLLGATYQLRDDAATSALAVTGFESATRLGAGGAWPQYLAGISLLREQRAREALDAFAQAVIAAPGASWAYEGLAAAAYMAGDTAIARAAAGHARKLDGTSPLAWRTAVLAAAGEGDRVALSQLIEATPGSVGVDQRQWVSARAASLLQTAMVDTQHEALPEPMGAAADSAAALPPRQLTVDVVLILGDVRRSKAYGVNLLDALQLQFGRQRQYSRISDVTGSSSTTSITELIRIPDITYNLNIFNRGNRWYDVIARPSLSAFLGEQSTFFVGEQLNVAVSGVNVAQLEKIDVGVGLKITPAEIRGDGARFRIEADRSFFSDQGVGSFSQQLATFKQNVAATADVRFGETLVLSGLSESVSDGNRSDVPVLGDIPGVNVLFSRKTDLRRERSVIILVTPSAPLGFASGARRDDAVEKLLRLWDTLVEPVHGMAPLLERIGRRPTFSRAAVGDVQARDLRDPRLMQDFIASLQPPSPDIAQAARR